MKTKTTERTGMETEEAEYAVEWSQARKLMLQAVISQLIRDEFGLAGLRIYNLLNENDRTPQKWEDTRIFRTCMVPPDQGADVLNKMTLRHIVKWQEVGRN